MVHFKKIQRDTSNFVYTSHGLLVEMTENTHWFWDASRDHHGTTLGKLTLENTRQHLSSSFMTKFADEAQWTRASTFPTRVVEARQTYKERPNLR
jgi:hypothetical protein